MKQSFTPISSLIKSVQWDDDSEQMLVTFNSGAEFVYKDVPYHIYKNFEGATSAGKYFAQNIKGRYE